jgi:hypothetical protein
MKTFTQSRSIQLECLRLLLWPIVRYCLRHSHSYQDFINVAKVVFVNAAEEEILKTSPKVNVSRISALTGIYRDDVRRLYKDRESHSEQPLSVLGRVIGQWEQDKRFLSSNGKPRALTYQGTKAEFQRLVAAVSKHLNPGTVLFELARIGAVKKTKGMLQLNQKVGALATDPREGFELLSKDVDTLIHAVEENLLEKREVANLHIRTEYDNIFQKDMNKIRKWFVREGKMFHKKARDFLSKYDQDINPDAKENLEAK